MHNKVQLKGTLNESLRFMFVERFECPGEEKHTYTVANVVSNGNQKLTQSTFFRPPSCAFCVHFGIKSQLNSFIGLCVSPAWTLRYAAHIAAIMFLLLCIDYRPLSLPSDTGRHWLLATIINVGSTVCDKAQRNSGRMSFFRFVPSPTSCNEY